VAPAAGDQRHPADKCHRHGCAFHGGPGAAQLGEQAGGRTAKPDADVEECEEKTGCHAVAGRRHLAQCEYPRAGTARACPAASTIVAPSTDAVFGMTTSAARPAASARAAVMSTGVAPNRSGNPPPSPRTVVRTGAAQRHREQRSCGQSAVIGQPHMAQ
jgi:hypothetical protein